MAVKDASKKDVDVEEEPVVESFRQHFSVHCKSCLHLQAQVNNSDTNKTPMTLQCDRHSHNLLVIYDLATLASKICVPYGPWALPHLIDSHQ